MRALMQSWQSLSWFLICSKRSKLAWEDDRSLRHVSISSTALSRRSISTRRTASLSWQASLRGTRVCASSNAPVPPTSTFSFVHNFVSTDCNGCVNARYSAIVLDRSSVGRGVIAFRRDGLIVPASPTSVMKIPKLHATVLPNGSLEPDEDSIWHANSMDWNSSMTGMAISRIVSKTALLRLGHRD
jgi:hypothetical protein